MAGFMVFGALILSICVLVLVVLKIGKLHGQEYPSGGCVLRRTRTFQSCSAGRAARRQFADAPIFCGHRFLPSSQLFLTAYFSRIAVR